MRHAITILALFLSCSLFAQEEVMAAFRATTTAPPSGCLTTGINTRFGNSNDVWGIWDQCPGFPCGVFMSAQYIEMTAGDNIMSQCIDLATAGITEMEVEMTFSWSNPTDALWVYYFLPGDTGYTLLGTFNGANDPSPFTVDLSSISGETNVILRFLRPFGSASTEFINYINFQ